MYIHIWYLAAYLKPSCQGKEKSSKTAYLTNLNFTVFTSRPAILGILYSKIPQSTRGTLSGSPLGSFTLFALTTCNWHHNSRRLFYNVINNKYYYTKLCKKYQVSRLPH